MVVIVIHDGDHCMYGWWSLSCMMVTIVMHDGGHHHTRNAAFPVTFFMKAFGNIIKCCLKNYDDNFFYALHAMFFIKILIR